LVLFVAIGSLDTLGFGAWSSLVASLSY